MNEKFLKRLSELQQTSAEEKTAWDEWPNERAFEDAQAFISKCPDGIRLPLISVCDDGELNFFWKWGSKAMVDLGFYGDGTFSYYAEDVRDGETLSGDDVPAQEGPPKTLLEFIDWRGA